MSNGVITLNRNIVLNFIEPTRMAVAAYFPFDGQRKDRNGVVMDWPWAMQQWDRVAQAGTAVRLVVGDQSYSDLQSGTQRHLDMLQRITACRNQGQLVFGYVYGAGGTIPIGPTGTWWKKDGSPGQPGQSGSYRCVGDQIAAWQTLYGASIDGIYVDVGPTWCLGGKRDARATRRADELPELPQ
jgi:hypothetical protein